MSDQPSSALWYLGGRARVKLQHTFNISYTARCISQSGSECKYVWVIVSWTSLLCAQPRMFVLSRQGLDDKYLTSKQHCQYPNMYSLAAFLREPCSRDTTVEDPRPHAPILLLEFVIAHRCVLDPLPSVHVVAICRPKTHRHSLSHDCMQLVAHQPWQVTIRPASIAGRCSARATPGQHTSH